MKISELSTFVAKDAAIRRHQFLQPVGGEEGISIYALLKRFSEALLNR